MIKLFPYFAGVLLGSLGSVMIACQPPSAVIPAETLPIPPSRTQVPPDYSHTPIIFVHGSGLNAKTWEPMVQSLVDAGYPSSYLKALNLIPSDGSNSRAAEQFIAPAVESLLTQAQTAAKNANYRGKLAEKIDFVTHSMGAISSRWYATQMRPERVRTWIAIAAPNYGADTICPYPSPGHNEVCPAFATSKAKNPLQITLNGTPDQPVDPTPYGLGKDAPNIPRIPPDATRNILYLTVRIEPDYWIKPGRIAMIEGAGGWPIKIPADIPVKETTPGNYLFTPGAEHDLLPQHPDLLNVVKILLAARDRSEPKG
jgi:pimeloyl-ACP methyl ester carboxylesterase